jgi:hypothetical protein
LRAVAGRAGDRGAVITEWQYSDKKWTNEGRRAMCAVREHCKQTDEWCQSQTQPKTNSRGQFSTRK